MNHSLIYLVKINLLVFILTIFLLITAPLTYTVVITCLLTYICVYVIGVNMFHRYWAHRQFKLTKPFQLIFGYLGMFTMVGDPLTFAMVHRYHHKHADTDKDLHSPIHGRFHSFIGWMIKPPAHNIPLSTVRDLLTSEFNYLKNYIKYQVLIIWGTLGAISLFSHEILLGIIMGMCISFVLEMAANTFNHSVKTKSAINNMIYSYMTLNAPHLSHHQNSVSSINDPGRYMIKVLAKLKILSYK